MLRARGRWNRYGEYGCLYTALSRTGATGEFQKVARQAGLEPEEWQEFDLVTIHVELAKVLDVTDPRILQSKGLTIEMLTADTDDSLELCRSIADFARTNGYAAILSPSAAVKGEKNLNIYFDGRAGDVTLDVGSIREPLNY